MEQDDLKSRLMHYKQKRFAVFNYYHKSLFVVVKVEPFCEFGPQVGDDQVGSFSRAVFQKFSAPK